MGFTIQIDIINNIPLSRPSRWLYLTAQAALEERYLQLGMQMAIEVLSTQ